MSHERYDVAIIGGGPAGMAAALGAREGGADGILIIERDRVLGGILNQCIHDGFGLFRYGESLSGPEYAELMIEEIRSAAVSVEAESMVLELSHDLSLKTNSRNGYRTIQAGAVVLAMGCRERTRGMIEIPGSRPAGIYTAGCAQNLVNLQNLRIGNRAVILGSGDIGLIMARRLTLEGMDVLGVHEIQSYCNGLDRNRRQCLNDYGIPLLLSSTVVEIRGKDRLESVVTARVDENLNPITDSEEEIPCDTLLLSVGLIPENELPKKAGVRLSPFTGGAEVDETFMTSVSGIFSSGNVLHIHDIADFASSEAFEAGKNAANYSHSQGRTVKTHSVIPGSGIRYCVPQRIRTGADDVEISFRVAAPVRDVTISVREIASGRVLAKSVFSRLVPSELMRIRLKEAARGDIEVLCNV